VGAGWRAASEPVPVLLEQRPVCGGLRVRACVDEIIKVLNDRKIIKTTFIQISIFHTKTFYVRSLFTYQPDLQNLIAIVICFGMAEISTSREAGNVNFSSTEGGRESEQCGRRPFTQLIANWSSGRNYRPSVAAPLLFTPGHPCST
jgi:hypothetical protein